MKFKKYVIIMSCLIVIISSIYIFGTRKYNQLKINNQENIYEENKISKIAKASDEYIKLYNNGNWVDFEIKGIRLSSYFPCYERNRDNIDKEKVKNWLKQIKELNCNTIIIPYIQPTGFYEAIYEYNVENEDPLYMIHELPINLRKSTIEYNAFNEEFYKFMESELKNTIDVVHGMTFLLDDTKHHTGFYLKDLSKFNIGYILGNDTTPEFISLTNSKNPNINSYDGKFYSIENSDAYNVFITKLLDVAQTYEYNKYNQISLLSYVNSAETDIFEYDNNTKLSQNTNIDLGRISEKVGAEDTIFISIVAYPNDPDFLYTAENENTYKSYLENYTTYYKKPVIISSVGMSSSRGKSKVTLNGKYDRGNMTEEEQGTKLVELLKIAKSANINGVCIDSFQDDWGRASTANLKAIMDKDTTIYWQDMQASDESFGLLAFEIGKEKATCYIDGDFSEWEDTKEVIKEDDYSLKIKSDTKYLYLNIYKKDWKITEEDVYIGIDTIKELGSNKYEEDDVEFSCFADFIIHLNGYNTSDIRVNERYDIFSYQYKYHEYILEKQDYIPRINVSNFSPVYLLNRKRMYIKETGELTNSIYYETGNLEYGNANPNSNEYNSLADFYKKDDNVEIRIPWGMLNFKNPIDGTILGDVYSEGINSERKINSINFSINIKSTDTVSKEGTYEMEKINSQEYHERLKQSYYIVQEYWRQN